MVRKMRRRLGDMGTIKRLLQDAEAIARREGLTRPAAEHLVLAALDLPDGTARAALERTGASADAFASAVREQHAAALRSAGVIVDDDLIDAGLPEPGEPTGVYRSETSAKELFQRASADARAEGGGLLGAHIMRSAAEREHGTVARVFRHMGLDAGALCAAATAEIAAARAK